jgi:hypothetical protein
MFLIVFALGTHRLPPWRETGMWTYHARLWAIVATILLLSFAYRPAFARGSQVRHDDPLNSERIDRLPPEVRNASSRCARIPVRVTILRPISTILT